jgi:hypothetical protein
MFQVGLRNIFCLVEEEGCRLILHLLRNCGFGSVFGSASALGCLLVVATCTTRLGSAGSLGSLCVWQFLRRHKTGCVLRCFLGFGCFALCVGVWQRCFLSHAAWKRVRVDVAVCRSRKR